MKLYIPEHIPSGNKGEEAIIEGLHDGLKNLAPSLSIAIFSFTPDIERMSLDKKFRIVSGLTFRPNTLIKKGVFFKIFETAVIWLKHIFFLALWTVNKKIALFFYKGESWKVYIESDVILVGHDGVFSDINLLFVLFCKGIKKKAAVFGCGFKPFRFSLSEWAAKYILSKVDLIVLREKSCLEYLLKLHVPEDRIKLRPDPAFLMKPASDTEVSNILSLEGLLESKRPLIGVIAVQGSIHSRYFHEKVIENQDKLDKHISFFAQMVDVIINTTGGTVVFLPHCVQESLNRDDRVIAKKIKGRVTNKKNVILIENEYNARLLKGIISQLDFLLSQRLHAVIGATTVGTPFIMVAVKQDSRAHDIVEGTINIKDSVFDINNPTIENFEKIFQERWEARVKLKEELLARSYQIEKDCNEAFQWLAELK